MPVSSFTQSGDHLAHDSREDNLEEVAADKSAMNLKEVRYCSVRGKDYLMLPLALLSYPVQWLEVQVAKHATPVASRHAMSPFSCLLYRRYFTICEKPAGPAS